MAPPPINPTPEHPGVLKPHAATLRPSTICPETKEGRRRKKGEREGEEEEPEHAKTIPRSPSSSAGALR